MTLEEVEKKLIDKGFTVKRTEIKITDEDIVEHRVEHRGETVGVLYDTYVCIAKYYPSLNPNGVSTHYTDADKFVIMLSHPISEIDTAIQWLLESPERIDRVKRKNRIDAIRRYFDERRHPRSIDQRHTSKTSPSRPILSSYMGSARLYPPRHSTYADEASTL